MAIDTSLFGANLPVGTYTAGDVITLKNLRGPAIVRDGYGAAYLKRMISGIVRGTSAAKITGHVVVKNSNWVDEMANIAAPVSAVALAENSTNIQRGHDCKLTANSGWEVKFIVDETVTTTSANDVFCLLDVDYPQVQAVMNPRTAPGAPVTVVRNDSVSAAIIGSIETASWTTYNIDILKAGYRYLLTEMGAYSATVGVGFVSISQAAGQQGLERIIPCIPGDTGHMRYLLDYSTPLVKGPMNLNYMMLASAAGTISVLSEIDWVKA